MKANLANRPSIDRIREVLAYDPDTGILRAEIERLQEELEVGRGREE